MVQNIRISGNATVGTADPTKRERTSADVEGRWRGERLVLATTAQNHLPDAYGTKAGLPAIQRRDLSSRRVATEAPFRSLPTTELFRRADTLGIDIASVRRMARSSILGRDSNLGPGRSNSTARYLSLQLAAACLDEGSSPGRATTLLTPVKAHAQDPQDLADLLQHAANDAEAFEHILEDILAGLDTLSQDGEELSEKLRKVRYEPDKLVQLLRQVQDIPDLQPEERRELRQRIQHDIREFEKSSEGGMVLAAVNAAPVASEASDPTSFLETYQELVSTSRTFSSALKLLLSRFPIDSLVGMLEKMKKALGDDLSAITPSYEPRHLGSILSDLSNMHISSTLIEMVSDLVAQVHRTSNAGKPQ